MQCLLAAINDGLSVHRSAGSPTEGSAYRYEVHPNEFVLRLITQKTTRTDPSAHAAIEIATSLRRWLCEISMEFEEHKVMFARIHSNIYSELEECGLLLATASCVAVAACRRSLPGCRLETFERVASDFALAAADAIGRNVDMPTTFVPTISSFCVLGEDLVSIEVMRELCGAVSSDGADLSKALRKVTREEFAYSSLLVACDCLPIPTKQSKEWMRCLRRCLLALSSSGLVETLSKLASACPYEDAVELFCACRQFRALDCPPDCNWSFLLLATFAVVDDSFSQESSHLPLEFFSNAPKLLACLCAHSRCKFGVSIVSCMNAVPQTLEEARLQAETLSSIARSPSGFMSPAFSTRESAYVLCEWASQLIDVRDDIVLNCLREFANVPPCKRTHAWSESLSLLSTRVDAELDLRRGPLPWFFGGTSRRLRVFARAVIDEAARVRVVADADRAVVLCLWLPVDKSNKQSIRIFARRFADPSSVDINDAIYEFEDGLRRAWAAYPTGEQPRHRFRGRFDHPRLDETTDAVLVAASTHRGCVATCSDVDQWTAAGRPSITVAHWAQARALRIR